MTESELCARLDVLIDQADELHELVDELRELQDARQ
jgi:hypothetical protein